MCDATIVGIVLPLDNPRKSAENNVLATAWRAFIYPDYIKQQPFSPAIIETTTATYMEVRKPTPTKGKSMGWEFNYLCGNYT